MANRALALAGESKDYNCAQDELHWLQHHEMLLTTMLAAPCPACLRKEKVTHVGPAYRNAPCRSGVLHILEEHPIVFMSTIHRLITNWLCCLPKLIAQPGQQPTGQFVKYLHLSLDVEHHHLL
jgi:hypothetical protein